jgi:hypothetical protein
MNEELQNLIDQLKSKGATQEEIDIVVEDFKSSNDPLGLRKPDPLALRTPATGDKVRSAFSLGKFGNEQADTTQVPQPKKDAGFFESFGKQARNVITNVVPETFFTSGLMKQPSTYDELTPEAGLRSVIPGRQDFKKGIDELLAKSNDLEESYLKTTGDVDEENYNWQEKRTQSKIANTILKEIKALNPNPDPMLIEDHFITRYNQFLRNQSNKQFKNIKEQQEDSKELLKTVPTSFKDGNTSGTIGGAIGAGVAQIPLSVLTGGSSSILMERAAIYNEAVNEKAKMLSEKYGTDISPEELRALGEDKDVEALATGFGSVSGLLDRFSAGKVMSPLTRGVVKKKLTQAAIKKGVVPQLLNIASSTATEGATGFIQDINAQVATKMSTGKSFDEAIANVDYSRAFDAAAMEAVGGAGVSTIVNATTAVNDAIKSIPVEPTIAAEQDIIFNEVTNDLQPQTPVGDIAPTPDSIQRSEVSPDGVQPMVGTPDGISSPAVEPTLSGSTGEVVSQPSQVPQVGENISSGDQVQSAGIEAIQPSSRSTGIQQQINRDVGITREKNPVTSDEYTLLKKQIRDFSRGVRQGVAQGVKEGTKEVRDDVKAFGQLVSDFLSGTKRTGQMIQKGTTKDGKPIMVEEVIKTGGVQLSENRQNAIIKRMTRVNLNNQRSVDSFLNYLGRAIGDERYNEKVNDTETTISKIKSKSFPATSQPEIKKFLSTPIEYIDIDTHQDIANKISAGMSQPGSAKYKSLNLQELASYNDKVRREVQTQRNAELAEHLGTFSDSELSPEEIDMIMSDEDVDPFAANATEARKTQVRDALLKQAEYVRMGLDNSIVSTPQESEVLSAMKELDIQRLEPKELKAYIKAVDNAIVNGDYSGTGWIWAKNEAYKGAERTAKIKALDVVSSIEGLGSIFTPAMMTKAMFGTSERAGVVNRNSGVSETYNGYTRTEDYIHNVEEDYIKLVEELDKRHGGDVRSEKSTIRQAIVSYLIRYKSNPVEELAQKKQDLKDSIERTRVTEPEVAAVADEVFAEFAGETSQEAIMEKLKQKDIKSAKVLEFFMEKFEGIVDNLQANTEIIYNEPFVKEFNYLPVTMKSAGDGIVLDELGAREGIYQTSSPIKPKRATTTIEATGRIPKDRTLNLDFASNMVQRLKESVYDIETAKHKLHVREFAKLPETDKLFSPDGTPTNKQNFYKYFNIVEQENRGKSPYERDAWSTLNKAAGIVKDISYMTLFGDPFKYGTQYLPGAMNTIFNLGPAAFFQASPNKAAKVMKGKPIDKRGARMGGTDFNEKIYNAGTFKRLGREKGVDKFFEGWHNFNTKFKQKVTLGFIRGDVDLAKRAWTAAYTKFLEDRNVKIDWNTEHTFQNDPLRQEAAAYAEQFVNENMGVNQSSQYAKALKPKSGRDQMFMNLILPLSGYPINMKTRMVENYKFMFSGDKKAREQAFLNQAGTFTEAAIYSYLTFFLLSSMWVGVRGAMSEWAGLDSPEDEEEKEKLRQQMFNSSMANDLNPIAVGDAFSHLFLNGYNSLAYSFRDDEDQTYRQWEEEVGEPFSVFEKSGMLANLGIYSIAAKNFEAPLQYTMKIEDGELINENGERLSLTQEQEDFIYLNAWVQLLQGFGIGLPFVSKQLDAIRREQIKQVKDQ